MTIIDPSNIILPDPLTISYFDQRNYKTNNFMNKCENLYDLWSAFHHVVSVNKMLKRNKLGIHGNKKLLSIFKYKYMGLDEYIWKEKKLVTHIGKIFIDFVPSSDIKNVENLICEIIAAFLNGDCPHYQTFAAIKFSGDHIQILLDVTENIINENVGESVNEFLIDLIKNKYNFKIIKNFSMQS